MNFGFSINAAARSHRDFQMQFQFTDAETGDLIDFTGATIAIEIDDRSGCQRISATTDNGMVSIVSTGVIELDIEASQMTLAPGSHDWGGYFQLNDETNDLFSGTLSIERGIPKP